MKTFFGLFCTKETLFHQQFSRLKSYRAEFAKLIYCILIIFIEDVCLSIFIGPINRFSSDMFFYFMNINIYDIHRSIKDRNVFAHHY